MTSCRAADLLPECADLGDLRVAGLCLDSRRIQPGDAFVALAGALHHGLDFADTAIRRGASLVLAEHGRPTSDLGVPVVVVPQLRARLGNLALHFSHLDALGPTVVGVTGTNGKTSTVQLIAQALTLLGQTAATIGTLGAGLYGRHQAGERTTPDVLEVHRLLRELREQGAETVAMEVSSHALDQGRVDGVPIRVAVFTNLTRDHLDYHGSFAAYAAAKASLFTFDSLRAAVINVDDPQGSLIANGLPEHLDSWTHSALGQTEARVVAQNVTLRASGLSFQMRIGDHGCVIESPLLGRFNVDNLLAVAAALGALGVDAETVFAVLPKLQSIRGRMNRFGGDGHLPLVVVDYAHTPDALAQALQSLRGHTRGRLICVFGCGGERDRGKRPQMARIAESCADAVIVTDDNPRGEQGQHIVEEILLGFEHPDGVRVQRDRALAIAEAIQSARPDDTVLIAGKGHESWQEVAGQRLPFDDSEHAARQLGVAA